MQEALRRLRTEARLSASQLAERAGLTAAAIYAIEQGARKGTVDTARKLAGALATALGRDEAAVMYELTRE